MLQDSFALHLLQYTCVDGGHEQLITCSLKFEIISFHLFFDISYHNSSFIFHVCMFMSHFYHITYILCNTVFTLDILYSAAFAALTD